LLPQTRWIARHITISRLDGWPICSPAEASPTSRGRLRTARADMDRYSFIVAAHTVSPSPIRDLPHRRLQPFRYLHDCSGCFRLERLVAGDLHTEKRRLLTEHTQCVIGDNWARYVPGWCGGASTARDRPTQRSGALNVASGVADDGEFNGEASFQVESAKGRIGVCAPGALKRTYDSPIFRSYLN
jgi:hypothetical protein